MHQAKDGETHSSGWLEGPGCRAPRLHEKAPSTNSTDPHPLSIHSHVPPQLMLQCSQGLCPPLFSGRLPNRRKVSSEAPLGDWLLLPARVPESQYLSCSCFLLWRNSPALSPHWSLWDGPGLHRVPGGQRNVTSFPFLPRDEPESE